MSKLLLTGASSMIGRAVFSKIKSDTDYEVFPISSEIDLTDRISCDTLFEEINPEYVIHCAGFNGGIQFNKQFPSDIFYKTAMMGLNVLNAAEFCGVKKVVSILPSCSYPSSDEPLNEQDFGKGNSHDSVECHGHAKRILFDYSKQIYKQSKGKIAPVCVVANNSFGPYDNYNPDKTKFIGGVIQRIVEAKIQGLESITFWGDGRPRREFIYCKDVAAGLIEVLNKYNNPFDVINLPGIERSIYEVVGLVKTLVGYNGHIEWDTNKANGQMRKKLDSTKADDLLNVTLTEFEDAIQETIDWYYENRNISR